MSDICRTVLVCLLVLSWLTVGTVPVLAETVPGTTSGVRKASRAEQIAASILKRKQETQRRGATPSAEFEELPTPSGSKIRQTANVSPASPTTSNLTSVMPETDTLTGDPVFFESQEHFTTGPGQVVPGHVGPNCHGCGACGGHGAPVVGGFCWFDTLSVFGGVHGFKSPSSRGQDGSFGFHEGVNAGWPGWLTPHGVSMQLGGQIVHSNFNGAAFSDEDRTQYFVTAGLFRRSHHGWQGGVVYDFLRDSWYYDVDLGQVRGELSWAWPGGSSFGVQFAASASDDTALSRLDAGDQIQTWESRDWYTAFYRVKSNQFRKGEGRLFAGFTGDQDGLIGADLNIPLLRTWAIETTFTYLIPDEPTGSGGNEEESWNVAINAVWYPGRGLNGVNFFHRPMFDVADNGSFMIRKP